MNEYKDNRPTFYHQGDKMKPIRAGGVLFYRNYCGQYAFLLMYNEWRKTYEDLGGRTDAQDKNIEDTISREVEEESNKIFSRKDIKQRLIDCTRVYIPKSKYLLCFIPVIWPEHKLKRDKFGTLEIYDNIKRTIDWIPAQKLIANKFSHKLNVRMANTETYYRILDIIDGIYE